MITRTIQLYKDSFAGLSQDIWILAIITLINRSGAMVIPFLSLYLTEQLGFSLKTAGIVMSCFGLGSVVGTFLGGKLTDRFGYFRVMFGSLIGASFIFMFVTQAHSFLGVCAMIFLLSSVADIFRPAAMASIAAYSTEDNRTRSVSLIRLSINLGFAAGPAVGGYLAYNYSYDWLFIVDALTCLIAAFLLKLLLTEKEEVLSEKEAEETTQKIASPYKDRQYLIFIFLLTASAVVFMQLFSTINVYWQQEVFLNEEQIGILFALNGLILFAAEMPIVYSIEKRFSQLPIVAFGAALIGFSFIVFNLFGNWYWVALLSILAISFGEIFHMPFANAFALKRSTPANRGDYMALYSIAYSVAFIFAPSLGMLIAEQFGFQVLWYLNGILSSATVIGFLWLNKSATINYVPET